MGDKLLIRSYNVGCGDCFYVRIPNGEDDFHILIDCGTKESENDTKILKRAIKHLMDNELPDSQEPKKEKRLDLIVVTHRHEDHIKGFDPKYFKKIEIKNLWITAAMDEGHKQAKDTFGLHQLAAEKIRGLAQTGATLSPELKDLMSLYSIGNEGATKTLLEGFKEDNPKLNTHFVYAGKTSDDYNIAIKNTKIIVLAPENDIDGYYLGKEADESLRGMQEGVNCFREDIKEDVKKEECLIPINITRNEFTALQSRMLSNALAFSVLDSDIQNNVSVVLLIEWKKHRLLFVGDAMWEGEYKEDNMNGSWNVMWKERKEYLKEAVDFLKVGHHGSHNATPWNRYANNDHEVNQILNSILPLPKANQKPKAQAIVSTKRKQYDTIPNPELLVEIGKRVRNTETYLPKIKQEFMEKSDGNEGEDKVFDPYKEIYKYSHKKKYEGEPEEREVGEIGWLDKAQPWRTDMESAGRGQEKMLNKVEFIDVFIPPDD